MGNKYTKRYTEEFERGAIALVDSSGKTVAAVAREPGISFESLHGWYRRVNRRHVARAMCERGVTRRRRCSLTRPVRRPSPPRT
ncbi:transposase [Streptomyces chitinivorans]|uniref:Transposase n=1 Tax=Streptomyces chitinivorans TaxID=1257027 RepID=A0ABW7HYY7_9ACTN|nr:transposase [Streptomyces chitinivorans]MDH2412267.1 transposase [Streptomyces chitinivorans]